MNLAMLLRYYATHTPGVRGADNVTVRLDNDNEPQPDLVLLLPAHAGGKAKVDADDYISGPPTLVCEIAASTVSIDLHLKRTAYRRNGVQECLVWRTEDRAIDWFELVAGDFVPIPAEPDGTIRSRAFPGLWIQPQALLANEVASCVKQLDAGLASPEHRAFAERLAKP